MTTNDSLNIYCKQDMKKRYLIPQMVEVKMRQPLLQSASKVVGNGDLNPVIGPGAGGGRAPIWSNDEGYDDDIEWICNPIATEH